MIKLPGKSKQWQQSNESDLFGNIAVTKNITFDNMGYLKLSHSPRAVMDESIDTDFNNPAVILYSEDYEYFTETWEEPFQIDLEVLAIRPTQITDADHPNGSTQSDAVFFGGLMPVTESNDLHYYDPSSNTWTDTNISLTATSQSQHPMASMLSLNALAVANVNTVLLYASPLTATPTLLTTLTILADFYITSICYFNQNLYIGTMNRYGGHAYLYVWNGTGTSAQSAFEVDSNIIFSICVYQDSVVCFTGNGSLLRFNGSGFTMLDAFPIFYTDMALTDESNIGTYKNVMKSNGDLLYIMFNNNSNDGNVILSQPDGIWCYDPKVGLHHRYSVSNAVTLLDVIPTTDVDTSTNIITVTTAPATGTEVYYKNGGGTTLGGLTEDAKYFTINVSSTTVKLATTLANALAGTAIDLTGTGNNAQRLVFFPNIDYGQVLCNRTTSLCVIERPVSERQYGTDIIWGAEVLRRDDNSDYGFLGSVSTGVEARGYFITPKVFSEQVTDNFNNLVLKFTKFANDTDKIIIKYRTTDDNRNIIDISGSTDWKATWTSSTTFTSTQTDLANAVVGDEIEILKGAAGGLLAHITTITENAGTYTITIDETFAEYTSGDISKFVFRNWKKFKTIAYGDSAGTLGYLSAQLGAKGKWIQVKVELRGIGIRIEEMDIDNLYKLPASR